MSLLLDDFLDFQTMSISEYFNYYTFDFTKLFENNSTTENDEDSLVQ